MHIPLCITISQNEESLDEGLGQKEDLYGTAQVLEILV